MRIEKKAESKAPAKVIKVQKEFRIPGTKIIVEEGDELEIYPAEVGYDAGADLGIPPEDDLEQSPFGEADGDGKDGEGKDGEEPKKDDEPKEGDEPKEEGGGVANFGNKKAAPFKK